APADQHHGTAPETLQPRQRHHGYQIAHVERARRRVEADVGGDRSLSQSLGQAGGGVVHHSPLAQHGQQVGHGRQDAVAGWKRASTRGPGYFPGMATRRTRTANSRPNIRLWPKSVLAQRLLIVVMAFGLFGFVALTAVWTRACSNNRCPSIDGLNSYDPYQASKVYAADGRLITDFYFERR